MDPVLTVLIAGGTVYGASALAKKESESAKIDTYLQGSKAGAYRDGGRVQKSVRARILEYTTVGPINGGTGAVYDPLSSYGNGRIETATGSEYDSALTDEVTRRIKAEYEALSDDAKAVACSRLKEQYPNNSEIQAIPCDASFEEMVTAVGAAVGTAAGNALCGPACGALGAIAGAYLGKELSGYIEDAWDSIEDWADEQWDSVTEGVEDAWDYIF